MRVLCVSFCHQMSLFFIPRHRLFPINTFLNFACPSNSHYIVEESGLFVCLFGLLLFIFDMNLTVGTSGAICFTLYYVHCMWIAGISLGFFIPRK